MTTSRIKPKGWKHLTGLFVLISVLNAWNNIIRLSRVPTHRVSDDCQHANQGQGADGERQSK